MGNGAVLVPTWWKHGGMPALEYSKIAVNIIKTFKLRPAEQIGVMSGAKATVALARKPKKPAGPIAGIPAAHLHYEGQIFLLDDRQWKDFSTKLMAEFTNKLSKTKVVSFEQLQKISSIMETL